MRDKLLTDALVMSVNKNLVDVTTVLQWASDADAVDDKIEQISRAIEILTDLREQLQELR